MKNPTQTYVILSEQTRNKNIVNNLSKIKKNFSWILIDKRKDFNLDYLKSIKPDVIFIPHWSYIIPKDIYEKFECIVFHMTDLPFGRGGSPLQNLIVLGKEKTKISALRVVKELDAGPIYLKEDLSLQGTAEEILMRANSIIELMIIELIDKDIEPIEQQGDVVHFKRRTPKESDMSGLKQIKDIYNYIRMLDAKGYPNAFIENEYFKFEFSKASINASGEIQSEVRIIKK
tara:strand:- start:15310 stop:16002 length:693 start_codon:yes stop_codon:yes gene_type:complete